MPPSRVTAAKNAIMMRGIVVERSQTITSAR
jgi:hypothetical protein